MLFVFVFRAQKKIVKKLQLQKDNIHYDKMVGLSSRKAKAMITQAVVHAQPDFDFNSTLCNDGPNYAVVLSLFDKLKVLPRFMDMHPSQLLAGIKNSFRLLKLKSKARPLDQELAKARDVRRRVSKRMLQHVEEVIKVRAYPHDMVAKMKSLCSPQLLPDFAKVQDMVIGGPRYTKHDPAWLTDEASQLSSLLWKSFVTRHPFTPFSNATTGPNSTRVAPSRFNRKSFSWKWAVVVGEEEVIEQVDEKEALAAEDELFNFASINTQPGSIPLLTLGDLSLDDDDDDDDDCSITGESPVDHGDHNLGFVDFDLTEGEVDLNMAVGGGEIIDLNMARSNGHANYARAPSSSSSSSSSRERSSSSSEHP